MGLSDHPSGGVYVNASAPASPLPTDGDNVAIGDGDGYGDIAVGVPGEDLGSVRDAGAVILVPGQAGGPTGAGSATITQDSAAVPGTAEPDDRFGDAVRLSDTNADGKADLAIGASGENNSDGAIWSLRGASSGITTTGAVSYGVTTLGVSATGTPRLGTPITS
ncbi:FG-GAP repeat protein [Streptomyces sp. NPDC048415]|uniref:FG-GAP repeat protein n=1 Tax=Streptomyces sp. NPDC048415 TaxID=3154822 RepID=UPI0034199885